MRTCTNNLFRVAALITCLGVIPASQVAAQTFTILYTFEGYDIFTGLAPNGLYPNGLTLGHDGNFYGTTQQGGTIINSSYSSGMGTVFKVTKTGALSTLVSFNVNNGLYPYASLTLSTNGDFYGTTSEGGSSGWGSIFVVTTNGLLSTLASFNGNNGYYPVAGVTVGNDGSFYGTSEDTSEYGGSNGNGNVFRVTTGGTLTSLTNFNVTNGLLPISALTLGNDGNFYGTTQQGGDTNLNNADGWGTVFKVTTNGALTTLVLFNSTNGASPYSGLIFSGNTLYGTTSTGGSSSSGTIFSVNTDGTGFTNLYSFTGNSDGSNPEAGLILSGNTIYGTANAGGTSGSGTIFAVNTNGTGFTNLHSFGDSDGYRPSGLILSGNTLYGTASHGGNESAGTIFSLSLPPPQLTIRQVATNVILTWPTYAPEVMLQSSTNLVSPVAWNTNLPAAVLMSGQNTVTIPISGSQKFFRLSQ